MRTLALTALAALLAPWAAAAEDDGLKPHEATHTVQQRKGAGEKSDQGARRQQGRVLTDSDRNSQVRKMPGLHKTGDITLKRGVISRDEAIAQRKALDPLKKRLNTRGLRTAEAEYAEKLHRWARKQDKRLLELQKIHTAYDRLKTYRDNAKRNGDDVSRIDPRLAGMEKKIAALSEDIRLGTLELQEMLSRYQTKLKFMSHMIKSQHDTAMAVARETGG